MASRGPHGLAHQEAFSFRYHHCDGLSGVTGSLGTPGHMCLPKAGFEHPVAHQIFTHKDGACKAGGKEESGLRKQCVASVEQKLVFLA